MRFSLFCFQMVGGKKHVLRVTYQGRNVLGHDLDWGKLLRMKGDVKKRLKTERLMKKYPEERLRSLDGELTMARKRNIPSSETNEQLRR